MIFSLAICAITVCLQGISTYSFPTRSSRPATINMSRTSIQPEKAALADKDEWTRKTNDFLKGSILDGRGEEFVSAAINADIDVRLSAAIAMAETQLSPSDGCFNVWNWNGKLGDNWEDAINEHANALSRYYDGVLTDKTAQLYAPSKWMDWENKVAKYMQAISDGKPALSLDEEQAAANTSEQPTVTSPNNENTQYNQENITDDSGQLTDIQHKVSNLASNPPDSLECKENEPLSFVNELYRLASAKIDRYSCAHEAMDNTLLNPDISNVPVGACLFSETSHSDSVCVCGRTPGDICVYIGDSKVAYGGSGTVEIKDLNSWIEEAAATGSAVSWGWLGNHELLSPDGEPAVDDENGPIKAWTTEIDGTHIYWTVVPPGHTPKLAIKSGTPESLAREYGAAVATNFTTNGGSRFNLPQKYDTLTGKNATGGDVFYLDKNGWWNSYRGDVDMNSLNAIIAGFDNGWHVVAKNGQNLAGELSGNVEGVGVKHPRTWIGQKTSGEFFSCVCDGMRPEDTGCAEPGMSLDEVYDFTVKYICDGDPSQLKILYNTDGGTSSAFVVDGDMKNQCFGKGTRNAILYYTASSCEFKEWKGSYND